MLHLYSGNRLEDLATILARILSLSTPDHPFQKEHILVQTPGMAQWVKMRLASEHGISAGYEFPLPSTFIWRCFQRSLDDIPKESEFNKPFLVWRLMRLLDQRIGDDEFQPLRWYLEEEDTQNRRFQLCNTIADIYDQYLMYRPDWIAAWEAGDGLANTHQNEKNHKRIAEQAWQPILWRDVVADVSLHNQSLYHRGNLLSALQERVKSSAKPTAIPERVFIFGVSALPPSTLQSLRVLAEAGWIEVHLFLQNPCRYYWGDIVDKKYLGRVLKHQQAKPNLRIETLHLDANPLLASWGRLGRDYINDLQEIATENVDVFQDYLAEENTAATDKPTTALLHYLQQDVLEMDNHGAQEERALQQENSAYKHFISSQDDSFSVQLCHSALREVEVLHDHLLAMFDAHPELTPKDVIVMLPDVNQYSSFVQAVFGQAQSQHRLPFSLIDQTANLENGVIDAYIRLLHLPASRFTLSELISLLEVPAILATFGIEVSQVERIRQWCQESGIRWGLDELTATDMDLPAQEQNTWQNGVSRMLLGYAIGHDSIWQDLLSYGEVEGLEAELAGKLAAFLNTLRQAVTLLQGEKKAADWRLALQKLKDDFFTLEEQDTFSTLLTHQIDSLLHAWEHARFDEPVDISVVQSLLTPLLQETQGNQRFLSGRINFCTLMPMRSVPFKVVCLLGMNEGVYPRTVAPMGFDLMAGDYRSGDRSRRDDDKYLFLEALMSARQKLYISYVGRAVKDNSELNPSILVSELLGYVEQSCVLEKDKHLAPETSQKNLLEHIITQHKLQPFNEEYYSPKQDKYFTYDEAWLQVAQSSRVANGEKRGAALPILTAESVNQPQLELEQLVRFYQHPARYFMQHRLHAFLQLQEVEESEDEPFSFDGLTRYQLKESILNAMQSNELDDFMAQLKLSGRFPYGAFGELELQDVTQQCQQMAEELARYPKLDLPPVNIDFFINRLDDSAEKVRLLGWLPLTHHNLALHYHVGELSASKKMSLWLSHLAYGAQGKNIESRIVSFKNSKSTQVVTHVFSPLGQEKAIQLLEQYVQDFYRGNCSPLPLPARTAASWCIAFLKEKESEKDKAEKQGKEIFEDTLATIDEAAWQKALATYQDDFNDFADGRDAYWQRFYPDLSVAKSHFIEAVNRVWLPLHGHLHLVENGQSLADFLATQAGEQV